ncbi:MAG: lamin tail domain-containing protein [Bacteroidota bacterium]
MRHYTLFIIILFISGILSLQESICQTVDHVVISEIYGGGGNAKAPYKNDFIELHNPTSSAVNLDGWSVQYASAASSKWNVTILDGSIAAHGFYLIQEASGGHDTTSLPVPDRIDSINLSVTSGKIVLCTATIALADSNPEGAIIIDKVGYGTANGFEGIAAAPSPSSGNTKSIERKAQANSTAATLAAGGADASSGNGYDTDNNSSDFVVQSKINPQNSASALEIMTADFVERHFKNGLTIDTFATLNNFPNPFNPTTSITFTVAQRGKTTVKVHDLLGREVAALFSGFAEPHRIYTLTFNASKLSSGIYICQMNSISKIETRKMVLLK